MLKETSTPAYQHTPAAYREAGAVMEKRKRSRVVYTRNRVVTFRVTDQELDRLQAAAEMHGSRCMSDFVRDTSLKAASRATEPRSQEPAANPEMGSSSLWLAEQMLKFQERISILEIRILDVLKSLEAKVGETS